MALCPREPSRSAILGLYQETMAYKPAFHACSAALDSFFYAHSAIVDSFVIVSFFLENHYILAVLSLTKKLRLRLFKPMFSSMCDKTVHL